MQLPRLKNVIKRSLAPALIGLLAFGQAEAAVIVGRSSLLNAAQANQLESWLGKGAITLTNIYTKAANDTSTSFHSAVNGKGPTFSLMSATENSGPRANAIIGGYNPVSWNSTEGHHVTAPVAERTAFIFNLSTDSLFRQNLNTAAGQYQTVNLASFGPTFGNGLDIYVNNNMNLGYSYLSTYSDGSNLGRSIINGSAYDGVNVSYGAIEVFSISPTAPVPEPEIYAMMAFGLGMVGFLSRRRKQQGAAV